MSLDVGVSTFIGSVIQEQETNTTVVFNDTIHKEGRDVEMRKILTIFE